MSSFCKSRFSKNINVYAIFNEQSFNDSLIKDIISFEQLGPDVHLGNSSHLAHLHSLISHSCLHVETASMAIQNAPH